MFNPANLNPQQKKAIIASMKATRQNPIAMLKLKVLQQALQIKNYVESNSTVNRNDFNNIWEGFQNQTAKLFDDFEQELLTKLDT